ncbi:MAG: N-formylglutamate amidohydrolase [Tatlockia sp.]|jgi:predicted N-formylglutamate amidohydrolase
MKKAALILSCEHAVNTVPEPYQALFHSCQEVLETHQGIDLGAETIANYLSHYFQCDLVQANITRLLIDFNRSLNHKQCFSHLSTTLSRDKKEALIQNYYLPYRQAVEQKIAAHVLQGKLTLHLSIHSFTPVFNNQARNADIGLLFDPQREPERHIARRWQQHFKQENSTLKLRLNYPYLGKSDGFTTALRKQFGAQDYAGIEVELNQKWAGDRYDWLAIAKALAQSLHFMDILCYK